MTALSQALKLEREGRAFYLKAAEEVRDERCRKTFLSLADDERMHEEMIVRQLHMLEGSGRYVLLPDLDAPAIDLNAKIFPPDWGRAAERVRPGANELDALHLALENEIKSYDLYRHAALETEDEAGKRMYTWLAGAEMTHFNLLMANYEAIVREGGWV
ncbi:MAG: ferritin family protein [Chloroflexi bacterium]|nr:ferritin family protein [Chloroflexota bacterium]